MSSEGKKRETAGENLFKRISLNTSDKKRLAKLNLQK